MEGGKGKVKTGGYDNNSFPLGKITFSQKKYGVRPSKRICHCNGILVYIYCLISISVSVSDKAQIYQFRILKEHDTSNSGYTFEPNLLKRFSVNWIWKLKVLQRMYGLGIGILALFRPAISQYFIKADISLNITGKELNISIIINFLTIFRYLKSIFI